MKLRSKSFLATLTLLAAFNFIAFSVEGRNVWAQTNTGKQTETKATHKAEVKSDTVIVTFVEIGSVKCIPCKAMQPIMKEVEEKYKGQVKVIFHDVWTPKGKEDANKYNIRVIPTQVFLDKDGKEYFRHEGFLPKEDVMRVIRMQGVK